MEFNVIFMNFGVAFFRTRFADTYNRSVKNIKLINMMIISNVIIFLAYTCVSIYNIVNKY